MADTLSTFIRSRRAELGLSRLETARRGGLPPSTLAYVERVPDARGVRPKTLAGLARALEVPMARLLEAAGFAETVVP